MEQQFQLLEKRIRKLVRKYMRNKTSVKRFIRHSRPLQHERDRIRVLLRKRAA